MVLIRLERFIRGGLSGGFIGLICVYGVEVEFLGYVAGVSLVTRTLLTPVICGLVAGLILRGVEASLSGPGSPTENLCHRWPLAALVLVVLLKALGPVLVVQHWYVSAGIY